MLSMTTSRSHWTRRVVLLAALALSFACKPETIHRANPEAALKENLVNLRKAIQNFHQDKKRYPYALEELVPNYLRSLPIDPVSNAPYVVVIEEPVVASHEFEEKSAEPVARPVVINVRSSAPGVDAKGVRYSDY
jgi:general secretion pathway protein G